jgi:hypothetical protein
MINQSRGYSFNVLFSRSKKCNFLTAVFKKQMVNLTAFGGFHYDIYLKRLRQTTAYLMLDKLSVVWEWNPKFSKLKQEYQQKKLRIGGKEWRYLQMIYLVLRLALFMIFSTLLGSLNSTLSFMTQQPLVSHDLLVIVAARSHSDTPQSVWLLRKGDQPNAETSIWQNMTLTRHGHPSYRRDSNPHSQQASGRRTTP